MTSDKPCSGCRFVTHCFTPSGQAKADRIDSCEDYIPKSCACCTCFDVDSTGGACCALFRRPTRLGASCAQWEAFNGHAWAFMAIARYSMPETTDAS